MAIIMSLKADHPLLNGNVKNINFVCYDEKIKYCLLIKHG